MTTITHPLAKFVTAALIVAGLALKASAADGTLVLGINGGNPAMNPYVVSSPTGPVTASSYTGAARVSATSFFTFCIEMNEHFYNNEPMTYSINPLNRAIAGGISTASPGSPVITPGYDTISNATALLYSQFAVGSLTAGGAFSYGNAGYTALQNAIWYLEGELTTTNAIANWAISQVGTLADTTFGESGVYVLNMTRADGSKGQDQLYFHSVPEAGTTVALLGLALLGIAGFRRKLAEKK